MNQPQYQNAIKKWREHEEEHGSAQASGFMDELKL
jgi:hypothetical protein